MPSAQNPLCCWSVPGEEVAHWRHPTRVSLALFAQHGFDAAAEIGEILPAATGAALRLRQG